MIAHDPHAYHPVTTRLIVLLATFFALFFALPAKAANVHPFGKSSIIIEGEIVQGDHAKLLALLNRSGSSIDSVALYSSGGSVFEAIKIGTLIRELRLRTIAPKSFGFRGNICTGISNQKNCTCLSACVLVFAGGIHHSGNVLGVHRSYVSNDFYKYMRGTHGINASEQLMYTVNDYLKKMAFPQQFIDTMNATRSQNISFLKEGEIHRHLSGYVPPFGERVVAKCGNWNETQRRHEQLEKKRISSGLSAAEQQQHSALFLAKTRTIPQCQQAAEKGMRDEVFDRVMKEARTNGSNRNGSFW